MKVKGQRTYVVLRYSWENDQYEALGTVVARSPGEARGIARCRWPTGTFYDAPSIRAAGSVRTGVLIEALARDGEARRSRPGRESLGGEEQPESDME